ncbi:hypothetical protein IQ268_26550 [Oculatella sp. LEGE 06141]|uniref:hypothetical protein n=1 Tax=Oculatella sp. LEGE 06141 TaxID=1828648 RepID=UPI0018804AB5|nr:hypothetical protein [Oculatella sp. LEGE 06141]MBE9182131.1 hypothetical protein [Oculatella sp. LEGE 06141]
MKIVWEPSVYIGNAPTFCTICAQRSYPIRSRRNQLLLAILYDQHGVMHGEVCRDCVAAGSDGITARLQERIHSLQAKVAELQTLARESIETPTLEEEFGIHQRDVS